MSNRPDIEELLRLAEKAMPGPWSVCAANEGECQCGLVWCREHDVLVHAMPTVDDDVPVSTMSLADSAFIAAAREAVPALAKYALELERERGEARRESESLRERLRLSQDLVQAIRETPWAWQGDGSDDLDSMSDGMGITILAGQLRALLGDARAALTNAQNELHAYAMTEGHVACHRCGGMAKDLVCMECLADDARKDEREKEAGRG